MRKRNLTRAALCLLLAVCLLFALGAQAFAADLTYTVLISARYEDAQSFSEGLAAVKQGGLWGYVDEKGNTVIPFQYSYAFSFSEGLAIVGKTVTTEAYQPTGEINEWGYEEYDMLPTPGHAWYVIDKSGNETPLRFANGTQPTIPKMYFDESTDPAVYYHNGYVLMNGYVTVSDISDETTSLTFDRNGNQVLLGPDGDYKPMFPYNEGAFAATMINSYGVLFCDEQGQPIVTFAEGGEYNIRPFNQGLAPYAEMKEDSWEYYWGFIDKSGNVVIEPQYLDFYVTGLFTTYQVFSDGIASVQSQSGKWGGIDKNGDTVVPFEYDVLAVFNEGVAPAQKDGKYGVINVNNEVVVPFEYDRITSYNGGRAVAVKDGRAFCIDRYGNEIAGSDKVSQDVYFPEGLDSLRLLSPSDTIVYSENNRYGFAQIGYIPELPQEDEMASWAYEEVIQAIENDLVPAELQNQYLVDITRADFAYLVVNLLTEVTGKDIDQIIQEELGEDLDELVAAYPFSDTTDANVVAANALGIITGRGDGIFDPYNEISRQEAAALLMRIGKYLGKTDVDVSSVNFDDAGQVQTYAKEAVAYVQALGVMKGTSDTTFSPYDTYTRQQAYMTIWRLYNAVVTAE